MPRAVNHARARRLNGVDKLLGNLAQRVIAALAAFTSLCFVSPPADASNACGGEIACAVVGGDYRIELPLLPSNGGVRGAYVFFHGYKGSAASQMQQRDLVEATLNHHLAFVAINGIAGRWSFSHGTLHGRDDQAFVREVLSDLRSRFGFTPRNTIIGGFSIGASMAFYTTCMQGDQVAAVITFSGVFWEPLPKPTECLRDPPTMIHFHGLSDETFPLTGRQVTGVGRQGNTFESIAILRERGRCNFAASKMIPVGGVNCEDVPDCIRGESLLCIHRDGHLVRAEFLNGAFDQLGFVQ